MKEARPEDVGFERNVRSSDYANNTLRKDGITSRLLLINIYGYRWVTQITIIVKAGLRLQ